MKTRVLVVEDSLTARKRMCEVLNADPEIEIVGEAGDGRLAIEMCRETRPDVITMDMILPVMSGVAATEYIMAYFPTPILVVSSSFNRGEVFKTYEALAAGAVDVLEKPRGDEPDGVWERKFIASVKLVSRIRVITHPRARLRISRSPQPPARFAPGHQTSAKRRYHVIAVGASTGGPGALVEVLRAVPSDFPIPVVIVLHINEPFGAAFAEWLSLQTSCRVAYAEDGQPVAAAAGQVVMAPPDRHLVVREGRLRLTLDAERHSCRPSVDALFESVAREYGRAGAACLLTGMGRNGAAGLLEVRKAGGLTIAQDEATCVVYGMPREAVLLGAAERVLPLDEIGPVLGSLVPEDKEKP